MTQPVGSAQQARAAQSVPRLALELGKISKSFGPVRANRDIDLQVETGTIHGIIGENGAGKSTLMKILYGMQGADTGRMLINGKNEDIRSSADAIAKGIGMVHQHFMLVPTFSVLENVMLGTEGGALLADGRSATRKLLAEFAENYGMRVDPDALVGSLPVGIRQRVEIIKALKGGAKILILDEPTGVLTPQETEGLFDILRVLKADGVTILLITHKLDEIMAITDRVSVMRRGEMVGHRDTKDTNPQELAELMVGRKVLLQVDHTPANPQELRLKVEGLGARSRAGHRVLENISFELRAGEILGVAGVSGNGQSELMETLAGMRPVGEGGFELLGNRIDARNSKGPDAMRDLGLAHIPEDRHHHGLILDFQVQENVILGYHRGPVSGQGLLMDQAKIRQHSERLIEEFDVRNGRPAVLAKHLSGGNQQKVVIAREVDAEPKVLIVGQPTRGVDVGAIEFIHKQLIALRDRGCAILLISVELEEIMSLSDRIIVMNAGRLVGEVARGQADENELGLMMGGGRAKPQVPQAAGGQQGQGEASHV
jgi:simple sugar transport system ATP-binding protein